LHYLLFFLLYGLLRSKNGGEKRGLAFYEPGQRRAKSAERTGWFMNRDSHATKAGIDRAM
jgi:hypothetical protein